MAPARVAVVAAALLGVVSALLGAPAEANDPRPAAGGHESVPGEVLVRFSSGATGEERASVRRRVGATLDRRVALPRLELLKVRPSETKEAIRHLAGSRHVAYAEPNRIYRVAQVPNDALFGELWGLHNTGQRGGYLVGTPDADIDAPEAWQRAGSTNPVTVAVVDTGVDESHPDLAPRLARSQANGTYGYDFVSEDWLPDDQNGHGTHVAATIAARRNDGSGVAGVAADARIMALRALDAEGVGEADDIASAFAFAAQHGAKVVNASLSGGPSRAISDAISAAPAVLFVAAAGNSGGDLDDGFPRYPCAYTHVNLICVGASDRNDRRAWYSSFGEASVDLVAPGSEVISAFVPLSTPLLEDFEGAGWTQWSLSGHWRRTAEAAAAGSHGLEHTPGEPYAPENTAVSNWVDLTGLRGCRLSFALDLDIRGEYGSLLVLWETPRSSKTLNIFSRDWRETVTADLSNVPLDQPVRLIFDMSTDGRWDDPSVLSDDRVLIDDVIIRCRPGPRDPASFELLSGTSMATPHVAGTAALLWGSSPTASLVRVRCALIDGVDRIDGLAAFSSTGGRLNAANALAAPPPDPPQPRSGTIATIAGSGAPPSWVGDGGPATAASLDKPAAVAARLEEMLIADTGGHRIRHVGRDGVIRTVAGTGDPGFAGDGGPATEGRLAAPGDVEFAADGGFLIADTYNDRVRRVEPDGTITTVAGSGGLGFGGDGGPALDARLERPSAVAALPDGGFLIADTSNNRIRRVSPGGTITTIAGGRGGRFAGDGGPASDAALYRPSDIVPTPDGGFLIADTGNHRVRKVGPDGKIRTVAGTGKAAHSGDHGPAVLAALRAPAGLAIRPDGSFLVSGSEDRVRQVSPDGTIRTVAGTDAHGFSGDGGPAIVAMLDAPIGIAATPDGFLIADAMNGRIRRVSGPAKAVHALPRACQRAPGDDAWVPLAVEPAPSPPTGETPGGAGSTTPPMGTPPTPAPESDESPPVNGSLRTLARRLRRALVRAGATAFSRRGVAARFDATAPGRVDVRVRGRRSAGSPWLVLGKGGADIRSPAAVRFDIHPTRRATALLLLRRSTRLVLTVTWRSEAAAPVTVRARIRLAR